MKAYVLKLFKSPFSKLIVGLLVGALVVQIYHEFQGDKRLVKLFSFETEKNAPKTNKLYDLLQEKEDEIYRDLDRFYEDDLLSKETNPFAELESLRKNMEEQMESLNNDDNPPMPPVFDRWMKKRFGLSDDGSESDLRIEDVGSDIVYHIKVGNVSNQNIKVKVDGYRVTVTGATKQIKKSESELHEAHFVSQFQRSFLLTQNVNVDKMKTEMSGDEIILRFPKSVEKNKARNKALKIYSNL